MDYYMSGVYTSIKPQEKSILTEHDELRKYDSELQPTDSEQAVHDISTDKFESIENASYRVQSLTSVDH